MRINIEFLVVVYFISLFVDWVFQWNWQAMNKSKWSNGDNKLYSLLAVASHSSVYSILTTIFTSLILQDWSKAWIIVLVLFISHTIIDTRIPVKWIMRFKGMSKEQINDYQNYGFMHIGIDHRLHEIVLVILALFV
jgi:biotin transporter BioY